MTVKRKCYESVQDIKTATFTKGGFRTSENGNHDVSALEARGSIFERIDGNVAFIAINYFNF